MIFPEVHISQPSSFEDFRGELYTLFKQKDSNLVFNHDKVSISRKNVLRGLHGDSKSWKLITCLASGANLFTSPYLKTSVQLSPITNTFITN